MSWRIMIRPILRSKRFSRAFRSLEPFFAVRTRENWASAPSISVALVPIFAPPKSEKCLEQVKKRTETLCTQARFAHGHEIKMKISTSKRSIRRNY